MIRDPEMRRQWSREYMRRKRATARGGVARAWCPVCDTPWWNAQALAAHEVQMHKSGSR